MEGLQKETSVDKKRFPRSHAECEETRKHQGRPSPRGSANTQQAILQESRAFTEEALLGTTSSTRRMRPQDKGKEVQKLRASPKGGSPPKV